MTTLDNTLDMLTGFLGDPMNISVVRDPFNEQAQIINDPLDPSDPPTPGSPSAPVVDAFGLNDPFPSSVSQLFLFENLDPTLVLGLVYIKTGVIIIRNFLRVILSIPDSELSQKEKANLINGALRVLFKDWCIGILVSRILAGEALSMTDVEAHVEAFWRTREVGVVLSVVSQVDIAYVSSKKRAQGWTKCEFTSFRFGIRLSNNGLSLRLVSSQILLQEGFATLESGCTNLSPPLMPNV